jgi:two-component system nitrogen regulation response regulator GlnG
VTRVSEDALALIAQYDWPGNVDELQSVLKRALVEGKGTVLATAALTQSLAGTHDRQSQPSSAATHWTQLVEQELAGGGTRLYELAMEEMERRMLPLVMDRCGGNQVKASRALGITRGSLRKKLRHFGLIAPAALAAEQSESSGATPLT